MNYLLRLTTKAYIEKHEAENKSYPATLKGYLDKNGTMKCHFDINAIGCLNINKMSLSRPIIKNIL